MIHIDGIDSHNMSSKLSLHMKNKSYIKKRLLHNKGYYLVEDGK